MIQSKHLLWIQTCSIICILMFAFSGCSHKGGIFGVDTFAEIPSGSVPEPAGQKLCQWQSAQVQQAVQDQTVLYKADFLGKGDKLAPLAKKKILRTVNNGMANSQMWVVESTDDPSQDSSRVESVTQQLALLGVVGPNVGIGVPSALGMPGVFAETNSLNSGRNSRGNSSFRNQLNGFMN